MSTDPITKALFEGGPLDRLKAALKAQHMCPECQKKHDDAIEAEYDELGEES